MDDARYLCSNNYSVCPSVQIIVPPKLGTETSAGAPTLPYVPSHLYHMLFETIKVRHTTTTLIYIVALFMFVY